MLKLKMKNNVQFAHLEVNKAIMTLDIIDFTVFGMADSKDKDWVKRFNADSFLPEKSPARKQFIEAVEAGYDHLASIILKDLDSSIEYKLEVDNVKQKWHLSLKNVERPAQPEAAVDPSFIVDFFHDDLVKSIVKRVYEKLKAARACLEDVALEKVNDGEYLDVNETKLEAIMHMLCSDDFMANIRTRKYWR